MSGFERSATEAEAALAEAIKSAAARGERLRIVGGGSKPWLSGLQARERALSTATLRGIVDYEPRELVILVRGGTPVADIERTMAEAGQMLAFEPPQAGGRATIGGVLAAALSGPRRPYAGAARDFVLGLRLIDGKGDLLSFGGRVMKNVAGFDVARLVCGSAGTLGVIAEVALKCLPLPKASETRVFELAPEAAVKAMNRWYAEADPISATTWVDGRLYVRFCGAEPAVRAAAARRGGEILPEAEAWWRRWREQEHPFFALPGEVMRMSCRSTLEPLEGFTQAIEWGGALRWLHAAREEDRARVRYWAHRAKGYAQRWHASLAESLTELSPAVRTITARLKASFDPYGVFPAVETS
ncbi:MAG: glycolate oxidase subunit GlcE [Casimicrobiaceae bacterium]|nr:glycolate oxidase subunit GlcE [Casimicrobiaceae bacterium]